MISRYLTLISQNHILTLIKKYITNAPLHEENMFALSSMVDQNKNIL